MNEIVNVTGGGQYGYLDSPELGGFVGESGEHRKERRLKVPLIVATGRKEMSEIPADEVDDYATIGEAVESANETVDNLTGSEWKFEERFAAEERDAAREVNMERAAERYKTDVTAPAVVDVVFGDEGARWRVAGVKPYSNGDVLVAWEVVEGADGGDVYSGRKKTYFNENRSAFEPQLRDLDREAWKVALGEVVAEGAKGENGEVDMSELDAIRQDALRYLMERQQLQIKRGAVSPNNPFSVLAFAEKFDGSKRELREEIKYRIRVDKDTKRYEIGMSEDEADLLWGEYEVMREIADMGNIQEIVDEKMRIPMVGVEWAKDKLDIYKKRQAENERLGWPADFESRYGKLPERGEIKRLERMVESGNNSNVDAKARRRNEGIIKALRYLKWGEEEAAGAVSA
jgi:hypothetical protein